MGRSLSRSEKGCCNHTCTVHVGKSLDLRQGDWPSRQKLEHLRASRLNPVSFAEAATLSKIALAWIWNDTHCYLCTGPMHPHFIPAQQLLQGVGTLSRAVCCTCWWCGGNRLLCGWWCADSAGCLHLPLLLLLKKGRCQQRSSTSRCGLCGHTCAVGDRHRRDAGGGAAL